MTAPIALVERLQELSDAGETRAAAPVTVRWAIHGAAAVGPAAADVTVSTSETTLEELIGGRRDLLAALADGSLAITGDPVDALALLGAWTGLCGLIGGPRSEEDVHTWLESLELPARSDLAPVLPDELDAGIEDQMLLAALALVACDEQARRSKLAQTLERFRSDPETHLDATKRLFVSLTDLAVGTTEPRQ